MPLVNVSVFSNFVVVAAVQLLSTVTTCKQSTTSVPSERVAEEVDEKCVRRGLLTPIEIRKFMVPSGEPSKPLIALLLVLVLLSIPWYRGPGDVEPIIWGLPQWGFVQLWLFVVACLVGLAAVVRWAPEVEAFEQGTTADVDTSNPGGVAPREGNASATLFDIPGIEQKSDAEDTKRPEQHTGPELQQPSVQAVVV